MPEKRPEPDEVLDRFKRSQAGSAPVPLQGVSGRSLGRLKIFFGMSPRFHLGCPADFNADGAVDGDDVIAYFADWDVSLKEGDELVFIPPVAGG